MAIQRHFGLAYRGFYTSAAGISRIVDIHTRARPMAVRSHMCPFGDDPASALLDEEFDDLSCDPGVLLQLANQA